MPFGSGGQPLTKGLITGQVQEMEKSADFAPLLLAIIWNLDHPFWSAVIDFVANVTAEDRLERVQLATSAALTPVGACYPKQPNQTGVSGRILAVPFPGPSADVFPYGHMLPQVVEGPVGSCAHGAHDT